MDDAVGRKRVERVMRRAALQDSASVCAPR